MYCLHSGTNTGKTHFVQNSSLGYEDKTRAGPLRFSVKIDSMSRSRVKLAIGEVPLQIKECSRFTPMHI